MLNSACGNSSSISARSSGRSEWRVCRSSGRGCTVSPCAPAASAMRPMPGDARPGQVAPVAQHGDGVEVDGKLGGHGEALRRLNGRHPYSGFGGNRQGVSIVPDRQPSQSGETPWACSRSIPAVRRIETERARSLRLRPRRPRLRGRCREPLRTARGAYALHPSDRRAGARRSTRTGVDCGRCIAGQRLQQGKAHAVRACRRCAVVGKHALAVPRSRGFPRMRRSSSGISTRRTKQRPGRGSTASRPSS